MVHDELYARMRKDRALNRDLYQQRLIKSGYQLLEDSHYSSGFGNAYVPNSLEAWLLHRDLLNAEGALSESKLREIESGIRRITINNHINIIHERLKCNGSIPSIFPDRLPLQEIDSRTMNGMLEVHLIAMKELNLDSSPEFQDQLATLSRKLYSSSKSTESIFNQRPMK